MQSQTQFTDPPKSTSKRTLASAFSETFQAQLRLLAQLAQEAETGPETHPHAAPVTEAALSGPFAVEEVQRPDGSRYAVVRPDEPTSEGGKAAAVYRSRAEALRLAAVLPAVAAPPLHHLSEQPKPHGCHTLHCGRRFLGHLPKGVSRLSPERRRRLTSHLDLARHLAANPHALALLLESAGPEALPILGRALARRVEAALP